MYVTLVYHDGTRRHVEVPDGTSVVRLNATIAAYLQHGKPLHFNAGGFLHPCRWVKYVVEWKPWKH